MPRLFRRSLQVVFDLAVLTAAYWLGFLFRFEFSIPATWLSRVLVGWPNVALIEYALLSLLGVPNYSWRYISIRETARIAVAICCSTLILVVIRVSLPHSLEVAQLPYGVLCMNLFLCFVGLVGVRGVRRMYGELAERKQRAAGKKRERVLLVGAGQAGVLVVREIVSRPDLALQPVGFLDDDALKVGSRIAGLPVLGRIDEVAEIAQRKRVSRVLITIANASGPQIRAITVRCRDAGLDTKIIPAFYEIVGDSVNLSRIREVAIEDLLGRDQIQLDEAGINASIGGAVVMVTGAGGSIGSELCRQVCRFAPARLVLVERFENALFEIHRELIARFPELVIDPQIADVTDARRMESLFKSARPSIVFHAAAHKHVPMMEANPGEAIKNNIGGTRLLADLADQARVERFVLISTDKAVNPTSVMGATKRVAEIYLQALALRSETRFVTVRFGNVLGSNGSVIPIFKQQIAAGGPVTVTHPEMQRYFMTIPEASQLVLQAGAMGSGGEIFILDMGQPVKIVDLARDLITLSGFRPDKDIRIQFSGVRPGEKLFEQLSTDTEHADKTKHPKIFIGRIASTSFAEVALSVDQLIALGDTGCPAEIRSALHRLVPEYSGGAPVAEVVMATNVVVPSLVDDLIDGNRPIAQSAPIDIASLPPLHEVVDVAAAVVEAAPATKPRRGEGTGSHPVIVGG